MTERKRQDRDMRRVSRAGPGFLSGRRGRSPVGERVVQAHLEHFCPGGLGFPVKGSLPAGPGLAGRAPAGWEGNSARAAGQSCGRCGRPVTSAQDVRRRACGTWVHEACPAW